MRTARIRIARFVASWSLLTGLACPAAITAQRPSDTVSSTAYVEDFDAAWSLVRDNYAYFDLKQTDWARVRELYRPMSAAVATRREFVGVLEAMMQELYDPHAHLGVNTSSSPRLIPSGADLWAEWRGERAIITAVRSGSDAELKGLRPGTEVLRIGDVPVLEAARRWLPRSLRAPDPAASNWALLAVLAGRRDAPVKVTARAGGRTRTFVFDPGLRDPRHDGRLTVRLLEGNIGYVRVNDALGDSGLIAAWDSALVTLRETSGLILDLRNTPSGGNTAVARGMLSRFIAVEQPYQRHELPAEMRRHSVRRVWVEYVAPRGPFQYDSPLIVLVGRWTGSMGEGIAIGLDAMRRGTLVGSAMAGLLGATYSFSLPRTGIRLSVPAERLYHVNGTPRERVIPRFCAPVGQELMADPALELALRLLRSRNAAPC